MFGFCQKSPVIPLSTCRPLVAISPPLDGLRTPRCLLA
ncbi:uncharacterized protein FPRO_15993 [Fusarium proliferatum ET1]|uniref:Uncharacterized protein n=1 Tax=Fusarium proliferatum (strain ET1) TaxID=1227346 RepID=A0A1L7WAY5_FUSPR|nr:uncharacterized protein FPRO_15993 [Fusarium proliferatum ET1]CZR49784.1 uncharacterized protein FPRO_15993 [Fusarium proliferatum ET1]